LSVILFMGGCIIVVVVVALCRRKYYHTKGGYSKAHNNTNIDAYKFNDGIDGDNNDDI